ncbi:galactosylceramide sulfotransferase-like [Saccoglossus kowalevskii]|uniref:Galactose-3-O-sulfotransferase 4-like n=1 Tax=Saccoglossus kowalevskii TaxID=10224 RepID=A0ABM0MB77_SACKO|nr:PREDICTED: galactose-3-O-sulfotransferase 4-like [Saccoglossus kowalevskii]
MKHDTLNAKLEQDYYPNPSWKNCTPYNDFVFVKTSKTGGSTVGALLYRYGIKHNLTAALPDPLTSMMLHITQYKVHVTEYPCSKTFAGYNYIAHHMHKYNHKLLKGLIPNAKFVTIIRLPFKQLESRFYFEHFDKKFALQNYTNPLETFLTSSTYHQFLDSVIYSRVQRWFSMTSDHGLMELDKEFDLVMITEYMDESLVLLKQMMCWTFDDVIYHSNKVSTRERQPMTRPMERVLSEILVEDVTVYKHFNMTLWRKIDNYDGDFDNDLRLLRARRAEITSMCERENNAQEHVCKFLSYDVHHCKKIAEKTQFERLCGKHRN